MDNKKLIQYYKKNIYNSALNYKYAEIVAMNIYDELLGVINYELISSIASKSNRIYDLSKFLLNEVFNNLSINEEAKNDVLIFVNLSNLVFKRKSLLNQISRFFKKYNSNPRNLVFIIDDLFQVIKDKEVLDTLNKLSDYGFKFAINNFGSVEVNFKDITKVNFDYLIIDSYLTDNILDSKNKAIIEFIVNLSKEIGGRVIVRNVTNEEQFNKLREMDIHLMEGSYFD